MDVRPGRKRKVTQFEIMCGLSPKSDWYFHLRSRNGKITLASEMYPSKAHCRRAIIRLIRVISTEPPIVVCVD